MRKEDNIINYSANKFITFRMEWSRIHVLNRQWKNGLNRAND